MTVVDGLAVYCVVGCFVPALLVGCFVPAVIVGCFVPTVIVGCFVPALVVGCLVPALVAVCFVPVLMGCFVPIFTVGCFVPMLLLAGDFVPAVLVGDFVAMLFAAAVKLANFDGYAVDGCVYKNLFGANVFLMVVCNFVVKEGIFTSNVELINGRAVVANVDNIDETANVGLGFCFVTLVVDVVDVLAGMVVLPGVDVFGVFVNGFLLVVVVILLVVCVVGILLDTTGSPGMNEMEIFIRKWD